MKKIVKAIAGFALGVLLGICLVAMAIGFVAIGESFHKPNLPHVRAIFPGEQAEIIQCINANGICRFAGSRESAEEMQASGILQYDKLRGALVWLDAVSPPIADWVRGCWEAGKLRFVNQDRYVAAWYPATKTLAIDIKTLTCDSDEYKAQVLAHEFRHSRQPFLPQIQRDIARLFGVDREDLVEAEAVEFEHRVARAIRGKP